MTLDAWLANACADARRRDLAALVPLLEGLATTLGALRRAAWTPRADGPLEAGRAAASAPRPFDTIAIDTLADADPAPETIVGLARRMRRGETSATALVERALDAIEARSASLGAFITVTADLAREQARRADAELAEGTTGACCTALADLVEGSARPEGRADDGRLARAGARRGRAPCDPVARLLEAGATIVGKCNLHEFAFGTTNEDSAWGPARHPDDPSRSPGGSSGGSAVAVATGMSVASVGSDTGGSVRIPAAVCGLVGLKPTRGELSTDGAVPLSWTLDHVGPLARSVEDAWVLTRTMRGERVEATDRLAPAAIATVRLGRLAPFFMEHLDPEVRHAVGVALDRLREAGATIDDAAIPSAGDIAPIYLGIVLAEAAAFHAATLERMPGHYTPNVRLRLEMARYVPAEDYARALVGRAHLTRQVDAALGGRHALVLPTLPIAAFPLGAETVVAGDVELPVRAATLRLTQLFDITGHPAITMPCGQTRHRLPIGLQIVGRRGETDRLLEIARAIESILR